MAKKSRKMISLLLMLAMVFTSIPMATLRAEAAEPAAQDLAAAEEYKIYPVPRDVSYADGSVALSSEVKVVTENAIDQATKNRLTEVLSIKGMKESEQGALSIMLGVKGSGGAVDTWAAENLEYQEGLFDKRDAYVLSIQDGVIAVLGKDTDAVFYGLSSLKMIFNQAASMSVRQLKVEDYASGQYRGFIEGYYGIPWSKEDRISLMRFGGDFKMNIYIYAPKDEPYHNSKWRELYPEDRLAEIKEMVEAGQASKCRFAWAIHPFMHDAITAQTFEEDMVTIKAKFQQLYDVGVRQFVLSADDAAGKVSLNARVCAELDQWCKEHEGMYPLCFVPQVYCESAKTWQNWMEPGEACTVANYFSHFADLTDVELMWTGQWVCHPASQNTFNNFTTTYAPGREAFMWLNWPVNDVNHSRLVMGPGEEAILEKGLTNFKGIVTNPLEQAEASKTALFAIADFGWNTQDFEAEESWADGFQYIDAGAPEALHELCKHLTNPSPGGITSMGESVELTPYITAFKTAYNAEEDLTESGNALIAQLQKIVDAADEFQKNGTNENLKEEMKPWVDSLRYISKACIGYVRTAIALKADDVQGVYSGYISAINNYRASQNCAAPQLSGTIMAQAGAMKIMPFAETMDASVKEDALRLLNSSVSSTSAPVQPGSGEQSLIYNGIGTIYASDAGSAIEHITDGNDTTYAWFNDAASANAYIGLDLGGVYKLGNVHILQGKNDGDGDIFSRAVLEYSEDNANWMEIGSYSNTKLIDLNLEPQSLKGRYVRLRTPSNTGKWYSIREFAVSVLPIDEFAYTNVEAYKDQPVSTNWTEASIPAIEALTLKSGEYIGLELGTVHEITELSADYTQADKLALEYSYNGFNWYPAEASRAMDAKWIRVINKGTEDVTFQMKGVSVKYTKEDRTVYEKQSDGNIVSAAAAVDNSLLSSFQGTAGKGKLVYRLNAQVVNSFRVLQNPDNISGATVSIRGLTGNWKKIGVLDQGMSIFEGLESEGAINEIRLSWDSVAPEIYEINMTATDLTAADILRIEAAKAAEVTTGAYTDDSRSEVQDALTQIQAVLDKSDASEEEISKAREILAQALGSVKTQAKADAQNEMDAAVKDADVVAAAGSDAYTAETWQEFQAAYGAAKKASADMDEAELKALKDNLVKAYAALKKIGSDEPDNPNKPSNPEEKKLNAPAIKSVKASAGKKGIEVSVAVDPVAGADCYQIYRTVKGKTVLVGTTASGKSTLKDTKAASIKKMKSASYCAVAVSKDTAVKSSDKGAAKSISFMRATPIKKATPSKKAVTLTWKRNKKAKGYAVYRSTKKASGYTLVKKIKKNKTVTLKDKKVKKGKTYYYKLVVIGKNQVSVMSTAKKVKVK